MNLIVLFVFKLSPVCYKIVYSVLYMLLIIDL